MDTTFKQNSSKQTWWSSNHLKINTNTVRKSIQSDLLLWLYKAFDQLNSGNFIFPGENGEIGVECDEYVRVQMLR